MNTIRLEPIQHQIQHKCGRCRSQMLLPDWVGKSEYDTVVFNCPKCEKEEELDISDYPKMRLRIYPLCQREFSGEKGLTLEPKDGSWRKLV